MIFTDTYQAIAYGRNATVNQVERLERNRIKLIDIGRLFRNENEINWAFQVITQAQFSREALESYRRNLQ